MKHFVVRTGLVLAVLMLCISGCMRSEADADHTAALQAYIAELEVIHTAEGHFFSQNAAADVSVRVGALAEDGRQAEAFLCVTDARTPLLLSLGLFDRHVVSSGSLYTADLDADGVDEIVYSGERTGNGGTVACVYRVAADGIRLMFDANDEAHAYGYTYTFAKGKKLLICNEQVSYTAEQDLSGVFQADVFDADGLPKGTAIVDFQTGDARLAVIDAAGTPALQYMQYVVVGNTASLGCVLTTLRYNAQTAAFEVTQAQYVSDGYFSWDSLLPGGSAVCVYQDGT